MSLRSTARHWAAIASVLVAAPVLAEGPSADAPARPECAYDREAVLALDPVAFDQTEGKGWRPLYDAHCFTEAAELLRDWRAKHASDLAPNTPDNGMMRHILTWHEAQMWAFGGRNELALPIFDSTYRQGETISDAAWNRYVDGTLAFLRRDRPRLEAAITELAAIPAPPNWGHSVGVDGKPISMAWPQNLDVLQGLLRCWEQPYAVAYVCRDIQKLR